MKAFEYITVKFVHFKPKMETNHEYTKSEKHEIYYGLFRDFVLS